MTGAEQLAVLSFLTLFIWVPFALGGWLMDRLDPMTRAWRVLPPVERHRQRLPDEWTGPIPLPSH